MHRPVTLVTMVIRLCAKRCLPHFGYVCGYPTFCVPGNRFDVL